MQKRGKTAAGTQRWYCKFCAKSAIRSRPDKRLAGHKYQFLKWITSYKSLTEIAKEARVSARTLQRWFEPFWEQPPLPEKESSLILVFDATSISARERVALIVRSLEKVVFWYLADRENTDSWRFVCKNLLEPQIAVCDAQKGLLNAIRQTWLNCKIQRCIIHIHRQANLWITQNPKSQAGQELRVIVGNLLLVRTRRQKRRWIRSFRYWCRKHQTFLKQKTQNLNPNQKQKFWYTHKKLRAAKSLIANAIPDMFRYIGHPEIPRTTNHLEGGINSPLNEIRSRHRGMSLEKREVLTAQYLCKRSAKKPPRNVV